MLAPTGSPDAAPAHHPPPDLQGHVAVRWWSWPCRLAQALGPAEAEAAVAACRARACPEGGVLVDVLDGHAAYALEPLPPLARRLPATWEETPWSARGVDVLRVTHLADVSGWLWRRRPDGSFARCPPPLAGPPTPAALARPWRLAFGPDLVELEEPELFLRALGIFCRDLALASLGPAAWPGSGCQPPGRSRRRLLSGALEPWSLPRTVAAAVRALDLADPARVAVVARRQAAPEASAGERAARARGAPSGRGRRGGSVPVPSP